MKMTIAGKALGEDEPCFIIAEAGINHNGDVDIAKTMIDVAKKCGVDAIKFQTFTAKNFVRDETQAYEYTTQGKVVRESMLTMFERYEFTEKEWAEIALYCEQAGIIFFSTPQDIENLDLLCRIGIPAIKVGSDDLINIPLLENYAQKGLPMLISTGMAFEAEIAEAVQTIEKYHRKIVIMHCVSLYPAALHALNMRKILSLREAYPEYIVGYSDHSEGILAAEVSVALGAKVFEKHFTLDKNMYGPDHRFSADPDEFSSLIKAIRIVEQTLGNPALEPNSDEREMRKLCHRSIVAAEDIQKGMIITEQHLAMKRPGSGLPPKYFYSLIGKKATRVIRKNQLITLDTVDSVDK